MSYSYEALEKLVGEVAESTDINAITDSYLNIADFFKYKKYILIFDYIAKIQDIEKSMPYELSQYRYTVYSEMMKLIKRDEGNDVYELLMSVT
jgi:hypothetical protein